MADNLPLPDFKFNMRVGMSNSKINAFSVVGRECAFWDTIHENDDKLHLRTGIVTQYDINSNRHLIDFGFERRWISLESYRKNHGLEVIERVDCVNIFKPEIAIHTLNECGLLFLDESEYIGPQWAQFANSKYGRSPHMWRQLKFDTICMIKNNILTPVTATIGDTFIVQRGSNRQEMKIVLTNFEGEKIKFVKLLKFRFLFL